MIESYQERQALNETQRPVFRLATIYAISTDGCRITFDGESEAGAKVYKKAAHVSVSVGNRVMAAYACGTYVIIAKI